MVNPTNDRLAVIVGASSGIGRALALEYARRGFRVLALARRTTELDALAKEAHQITPLGHDVKDKDQIAALAKDIESKHGPIDTLVYNAGIMPETTPETYDLSSDIEVIDVNLLGAMAWIHAVVPLMRARGRGHLVGISSIAGDRGRRGFLAYNTSKAALTTLLECVRNRVHRDGLRVTTIKPGYVRTAMTRGMEDKLFWDATPERAAKEIASAAEAGVATRYVLRRWALIGLIVKCIPSFLFRWLNF